jgi:hypothetical protein
MPTSSDGDWEWVRTEVCSEQCYCTGDGCHCYYQTCKMDSDCEHGFPCTEGTCKCPEPGGCGLEIYCDGADDATIQQLLDEFDAGVSDQ